MHIMTCWRKEVAKLGSSGTRILPLLHWPFCCNECSKFLAYFGHNFRPVTHYGMVIKRWNIAENNRRVNSHTCYEATDTFRGLFFKIWANNWFLFLRMQGGQIFILKSARLENGIKMTAMARLVYDSRSNMYPNWLILRDISNVLIKKTIFGLAPLAPI